VDQEWYEYLEIPIKMCARSEKGHKYAVFWKGWFSRALSNCIKAK